RDKRHHDTDDKDRERDGSGLTEPHDPEATHGLRSDLSPRGHGRAPSVSEGDRGGRPRSGEPGGCPSTEGREPFRLRAGACTWPPPVESAASARPLIHAFDNWREQRLVTDKSRCQAEPRYSLRAGHPRHSPTRKNIAIVLKDGWDEGGRRMLWGIDPLLTA